MMLFKLATRNMHRSLRDYALYFGTLIVSVSIFYTFGVLSHQEFLQNSLFMAPEHFTANIETVMTTISFFISTLLIFLIIYGNNFIIKRRKKELGIYLTLGMERLDVAKILFSENILIAILSITVGIGVGVPLSQFIGILIFHLLDIYIPGLTFAFSWTVVLRTTLYFTLVFLSVSIVNVTTIAKSKILFLLSGNVKQGKNSKFFGILSGVAFIIALAGFGYGAFTMLRLEIVETIHTVSGIEEFYWTEQGLDMVSATRAFVTSFIATFAFFLGLSGALMFVIKRCKKIAFRGLNIFVLRQLTRRLHLNWLSLSLITLMMTVSIFMLVVGRGIVATSASAMAYQNRPFDATISTIFTPDFDQLEIFDEMFSLRQFRRDIRIDSLIDVEVPSWIDWINGFAYEEVREIFNHHHTLLPTPANDEVLLLVLGMDMDGHQLLQENIEISYTKDWHVPFNSRQMVEETFQLRLVTVPENLLLVSDQILLFHQIVLVFPPSINLTGMPVGHEHGTTSIGREQTHFLFDFNTDMHTAEPLFWEFVNSLPTGNWGWTEYDIFNISSNNVFNALTVNWLRVNSNLMSLSMTFMTLYIGGIFLLVSLTILFLQQMIDVVESEKRYVTLSQLGVDTVMRNRTLLIQGVVYFLIPLIIASAHSFFALQLILPLFSGEFGDAPAGVEFDAIIRSMITIFRWVVVIYIAYFGLSYIQTKRMLKLKA